MIKNNNIHINPSFHLPVLLEQNNKVLERKTEKIYNSMQNIKKIKVIWQIPNSYCNIEFFC